MTCQISGSPEEWADDLVDEILLTLFLAGEKFTVTPRTLRPRNASDDRPSLSHRPAMLPTFIRVGIRIRIGYVDRLGNHLPLFCALPYPSSTAGL